MIGQTLPDFSSMNIAELSDTQIELLLQRASAAGLSQEELLQMAKTQAVSVSDIAKLNTRIGDFKTKRLSSVSLSPVGDSRLRQPYRDPLIKTSAYESDVFGLGVFKNSSFLSF